ncbi:hypothetical protein [Alkalicoccobacillus murimartini]|uniref:Uncharacterized protein n=1 Tax=Alkalicoccobacillus murimartini TaxID=171685 RepID=A0ABT9YF24_9BACI|nr:hypothetical protein [Alkalicoccobacillus murimartini]MDQ0205812.1 hypothetical protein [Alkalicoccobacillus murimartini]
MFRKLYLNMFLVVYQVLLMGSVSDYINNKKANADKTFRNINGVIKDLRQLTVVPKLKGRQPLTQKQQKLTKLLMKYENKELSKEDNLTISKECATNIAQKYDLFLCFTYLVLLVTSFFFPFWDYIFSLSFSLFVVNALLLGLGVLFLGILSRFSLRQKLFLKIFGLVVIASLIIAAIF